MGLHSRFLAKDGHIVRSIYELTIDNWLYENRIQHIYEPKLPFIKGLKADFFARSYYIEIWGMKRSRAYLKKKRAKVEFYKTNYLPLIEISYLEFESRNWQSKLTRYLLRQKIYD